MFCATDLISQIAFCEPLAMKQASLLTDQSVCAFRLCWYFASRVERCT